MYISHIKYTKDKSALSRYYIFLFPQLPGDDRTI